MVDIAQGDDELRLILRPNRSLSWRGNQTLFLCITVWLLTFAIALALKGAWVILPFVGIELIALATALYYVSWKLSHCEVLHITRDQVTIAKGSSHPQLSWVFSRAEVVVQVASARHPWGTPTIQFISDCPSAVRVGEFLNQQDCKRLLQQLASARLKTRRLEDPVRIAF